MFPKGSSQKRQGCFFALVFLLVTLVQGCTSTGITVQSPFIVPETEEIIFHPELPDPISPFMKDRLEVFQYKDVEGNIKTRVGFDPDDSNLFRIWLEAINKRTIKLEKNNCYYREMLKAPDDYRCNKHKVVKDEESN